MELLFDTANIKEIQDYMQYYPIVGVTSNPSILKAEGKVDLYDHLRTIRRMIGEERSLHVQVVAKEAEGMLAEAEAVLKNVDSHVYIKVPATEEGIKAMRRLKAQGIGVTATAIYTKIQGFMAIMAGADYIAPYCNRMENLDIDFEEVIGAFRSMIEKDRFSCKILAASFKNIGQVNKAFLAGAQAATVQPQLLHSCFEMPMVTKAVEDFTKDWISVNGNVSLTEL